MLFTVNDEPNTLKGCHTASPLNINRDNVVKEFEINVFKNGQCNCDNVIGRNLRLLQLPDNVKPSTVNSTYFIFTFVLTTKTS